MKLLFIAIFLGLTVSNCGQKSVTQSAPNEQNVTDDTIDLSYGESVARKDITLKFTEVIEDSRCPTSTTCIWAGRARINIEVTFNGKTETKTLIFGATRPGETANMQLYSGDGMSITAVSLAPHPDQSGAIPKKDYVVDIEVK